MFLASQAWLIFALMASVMWGIGYALDDHLLKAGLSPSFLMLSQVVLIIPAYLIVAFKYSNPIEEFHLIWGQKKLLIFVLIGGFTLLAGNLAILHSIAGKNAVLASLIEITFPFFVALFAYLFFKETQLNLWTFVGGVLIFLGIGVIYLKH